MWVSSQPTLLYEKQLLRRWLLQGNPGCHCLARCAARWEVPAQEAWDSQRWCLFQGAGQKENSGGKLEFSEVYFAWLFIPFSEISVCLFSHLFLFPQVWMSITKMLMEWMRKTRSFSSLDSFTHIAEGPVDFLVIVKAPETRESDFFHHLNYYWFA